MFHIVKKSTGSHARRGVLTLAHGKVQTPVFMPIATKGAVRTVPFTNVVEAGAQIVLANTYHLYLRPGNALVKKFGSLHEFIGWKKPILTDSGGFQVFSLSHMRKMKDSGVEFRSHLDGSRVMLTPEKSLGAQMDFGVDVAMVLDDVIGNPATKRQAAEAVERTTKWAKRSKQYAAKRRQRKTKIFGIVQGSTFPELREQSAKELTDIGFDGYAIGGLAVGESTEELYDMAEMTAGFLPETKPRYLMGVGKPEDLVESVKRGVDMFDCVLPTRNARHGTVYARRSWSASGKMSYEKLHMKNKKHEAAKEPIDSACSCATCATVSRGYLRHLFHVGEPLAMYYASVHNIQFYLELMQDIRKRISAGLL